MPHIGFFRRLLLTYALHKIIRYDSSAIAQLLETACAPVPLAQQTKWFEELESAIARTAVNARTQYLSRYAPTLARIEIEMTDAYGDDGHTFRTINGYAPISTRAERIELGLSESSWFGTDGDDDDEELTTLRRITGSAFSDCSEIDSFFENVQALGYALDDGSDTVTIELRPFEEER